MLTKERDNIGSNTLCRGGTLSPSLNLAPYLS
jgi:hypothetical protein